MLVMLYTCKVCETRSARQISKLAYTAGSVLVCCPGCRNFHMIADHLGYFEDSAVTVEELLKGRGELVRNGVVARGADEFVIELSAADAALLASRTKSIRLRDGAELEVAPAQGVLTGGKPGGGTP